jgi:hypothetical protein
MGLGSNNFLVKPSVKSKSIYDLMWREVAVLATRAALVVNYVIPDNGDYDKREMAKANTCNHSPYSSSVYFPTI